MKSSHYGLYELGYTCATMVITMGSLCLLNYCVSLSKDYLSSNCFLQLENMKLESLVITDQYAVVNMCPGLVHTARHITEVFCI